MSAAPSGETIFAWHHGRRALIFPGPDGQVCGITISQLAAVNYWKLDELALRKSLPRFDRLDQQVPRFDQQVEPPPTTRH